MIDDKFERVDDPSPDEQTQSTCIEKYMDTNRLEEAKNLLKYMLPLDHV